MRVFDLNPFTLRKFYKFPVFIGLCCTFVIHHMAQVNPVFYHDRYCIIAPIIRVFCIVTVVISSRFGSLISTRYQYLFISQYHRYFIRAYALRRQLVNLSDYIGRVFIRYQLMLVVRVFLIAIRGKRRRKFAVLCLYPVCGTDFL